MTIIHTPTKLIAINGDKREKYLKAYGIKNIEVRDRKDVSSMRGRQTRGKPRYKIGE